MIRNYRVSSIIALLALTIACAAEAGTPEETTGITDPNIPAEVTRADREPGVAIDPSDLDPNIDLAPADGVDREPGDAREDEVGPLGCTVEERIVEMQVDPDIDSLRRQLAVEIELYPEIAAQPIESMLDAPRPSAEELRAQAAYLEAAAQLRRSRGARDLEAELASLKDSMWE